MRTPIENKESPQTIPDKAVNEDKLDKMLEIFYQQGESIQIITEEVKHMRLEQRQYLVEVKALRQENAILKKEFQDENKEMKKKLELAGNNTNCFGNGTKKKVSKLNLEFGDLPTILRINYH
ncbi:hypothetical protein FQA39_LY04627 [Lamprigera yunnana]|nr:hypothetical protein FQA39_LY04627 [Lamprigera yunnana]